MKINFTSKAIDLHTHTLHSDGSLSPSELMRLAAASNLAAVAITDHDTAEGLIEGKAAADELGLEFVPGIEISAYYNLSKEIHLLGFYVDGKRIAARLSGIQKSRKERNIEMLHKFQGKGIMLNLPGDIATASRIHFGWALVDMGLAHSLSDAFQHYLSAGCNTFVSRKLPTAAEAIATIRACNGVPVLAHPMRYKLDINEVSAMIADLADCGLMGLETYYPGHTAIETRQLLLETKKHRLIITGGTDFHGSLKPKIKLGCGLGDLFVPFGLLEALQRAADSVCAPT